MLLRRLASLKLTLAGMLLLAGGAMFNYGNPSTTPLWVLLAPLALLALNLACAIVTNTNIQRQRGLLTFHIALFTLLILAGVGRLTHLDAHMEMTEGMDFAPDKLLEVQRGPWHSGDLDQVHFVQGPYTVDYDANMRRGLTYSHVQVTDADGRIEDRVVGDDRPLVLEDYRFYTTHNKGFSPVLTWLPDTGPAVTGVVNMPSYPLFEYKQDNVWTTPTGVEIKFWLRVSAGMTPDKPWVLDGRNSTGVLVITTGDSRVELNAGEEVRLTGGRLRYDKLTMWMGYRVFYDPTIRWMFWIAVLGVFGLAQYFWTKLNLATWGEPGGRPGEGHT